MRRLLISLFAIAAFLGCNKDDYPNDVIRTLASADFWREYETFRYTEPNGGGDLVYHIDPKKPLLGHSYETITIANGIFTRYIYAGQWPAFYYKEYVMKQMGDDPLHYKLITPDGEFYFKILEYDNDNLKVEYDFIHGYRKDEMSGEYVLTPRYSITHFKKGVVSSDPNWKDEYMSEKEYLEKYGK